MVRIRTDQKLYEGSKGKSYESYTILYIGMFRFTKVGFTTTFITSILTYRGSASRHVILNTHSSFTNPEAWRSFHGAHSVPVPPS